jgi:hypothetical protein
MVVEDFPQLLVFQIGFFHFKVSIALQSLFKQVISSFRRLLRRLSEDGAWTRRMGASLRRTILTQDWVMPLTSTIMCILHAPVSALCFRDCLAPSPFLQVVFRLLGLTCRLVVLFKLVLQCLQFARFSIGLSRQVKLLDLACIGLSLLLLI